MTPPHVEHVVMPFLVSRQFGEQEETHSSKDPIRARTRLRRLEHSITRVLRKAEEERFIGLVEELRLTPAGRGRHLLNRATSPELGANVLGRVRTRNFLDDELTLAINEHVLKPASIVRPGVELAERRTDVGVARRYHPREALAARDHLAVAEPRDDSIPIDRLERTPLRVARALLVLLETALLVDDVADVAKAIRVPALVDGAQSVIEEDVAAGRRARVEPLEHLGPHLRPVLADTRVEELIDGVELVGELLANVHTLGRRQRVGCIDILLDSAEERPGRRTLGMLRFTHLALVAARAATLDHRPGEVLRRHPVGIPACTTTVKQRSVGPGWMFDRDRATPRDPRRSDRERRADAPLLRSQHARPSRPC